MVHDFLKMTGVENNVLCSNFQLSTESVINATKRSTTIDDILVQFSLTNFFQL